MNLCRVGGVGRRVGGVGCRVAQLRFFGATAGKVVTVTSGKGGVGKTTTAGMFTPSLVSSLIKFTD